MNERMIKHLLVPECACILRPVKGRDKLALCRGEPMTGLQIQETAAYKSKCLIIGRYSAYKKFDLIHDRG